MEGARTGITLRFPREYNSWRSMRRRCNYEKDANYHRVGALGIKVCPRWQESFAAFLEDMGPRPSQEHGVLREDKTRDYEPGNCRWGTAHEQQLATDKPHWITYRKKTLCLADWAKKRKIPLGTLRSRLEWGYTFAEAIGAKPRVVQEPDTLAS